MIELHIPPLRHRREDVIPLTEHFLAELARSAGHRIPTLTSAARAALHNHDWPGNIRELRNRLERALSLSAGAPQLLTQAIFSEQALLDQPAERIVSLAEARAQAERSHIEQALQPTGGEITKAAALLGISRTTLWEKMRRLGF